jgi:uncharacterized protein (DUF2336 family)
MTKTSGALPDAALREIEYALETASGAEREVLLRRMTDLFLAGADTFGEDHVAVFDALMARMLNDAGEATLADLSERLASVHNAPRKVLKQLATNDAEAISTPVLRQSQRLGDDDLAAIAQEKGDAHLAAIAARERVSEHLVETLLERGGDRVARTVAANASAKLSKTALTRLVKRAAKDTTLAVTMADRTEVPAVLARQLFRHASGAEPQNLRLRKPGRPGAATAPATPVARAVPERDFSAAQRALAEAGDIDLSARLYEVAGERNIEDTIVTLAAIADLPVTVVERLLDADSAEGLLVLARAVDMSWAALRPVLLLRRGNINFDPDRMFRRFAKLSTVAATKIVQFWRNKEEEPERPSNEEEPGRLSA